MTPSPRRPAPSRSNDPSDERCSTTIIHVAKIRRVRKRLESDHTLSDAAEMLKVLGDPTRLKIVRALMLESPLCVCDLAALAGVSQSAVSHQLRLLRSSRLVRAARDGKLVYYRIDDEHVADIVDPLLKHSGER